MARVRKNQAAIANMERRIRARAKSLKTDAVEALEVSVAEGAELTVDYLEAAHTRTGLRRQAQEGGLPGRHDTGRMVSRVSSEVRDKTSSQPTGVFGWKAGDFEEYMRDQDLGEDSGGAISSIPPARALPNAFVVARERLRQRLDALVEK